MKTSFPSPSPSQNAIAVPAALNNLVGQVITAAIQVHRELGPGLLEGLYEECLAAELQAAGLEVRRQVPVEVHYRGRLLEAGFRADLLVASAPGVTLLVELKAVETLLPVHRAQVITYLRILDLPIGLLLNFNTPLVRDGVERILNSRWSGR